MSFVLDATVSDGRVLSSVSETHDGGPREDGPVLLWAHFSLKINPESCGSALPPSLYLKDRSPPARPSETERDPYVTGGFLWFWVHPD